MTKSGSGRHGRLELSIASLALGLLAAVPAAAVAAAPAAPADLTGVWWNDHPVHALSPVGGGAIPLTEKGRAALAENAPLVEATTVKPKGSHMEACLPFGPTRILQQPYPVQIIQKGPLFFIVYEHNHVSEQVYMNEKPNADADPAYMGSSVGRWDGAAAVIETSNFNEQTFLDDRGLPHSDQLSVVRRIRKTGGGKSLEIVATITDPVMYARPWSVRTVLSARPAETVREYVCGQNTLETRYTAQ